MIGKGGSTVLIIIILLTTILTILKRECTRGGGTHSSMLKYSVGIFMLKFVKDSAYYCYWAYIVRSAHLKILGFPMGSAY